MKNSLLYTSRLVLDADWGYYQHFNSTNAKTPSSFCSSVCSDPAEGVYTSRISRGRFHDSHRLWGQPRIRGDDSVQCSGQRWLTLGGDLWPEGHSRGRGVSSGQRTGQYSHWLAVLLTNTNFIRMIRILTSRMHVNQGTQPQLYFLRLDIQKLW